MYDHFHTSKTASFTQEKYIIDLWLTVTTEPEAMAIQHIAVLN